MGGANSVSSGGAGSSGGNAGSVTSDAAEDAIELRRMEQMQGIVRAALAFHWSVSLDLHCNVQSEPFTAISRGMSGLLSFVSYYGRIVRCYISSCRMRVLPRCALWITSELSFFELQFVARTELL